MFNRKKKIADRLYKLRQIKSEYLATLSSIEIPREEENTLFSLRLQVSRHEAAKEIIKIERDPIYKKYYGHLKSAL